MYTYFFYYQKKIFEKKNNQIKEKKYYQFLFIIFGIVDFQIQFDFKHERGQLSTVIKKEKKLSSVFSEFCVNFFLRFFGAKTS